jgi:hypothetical protein
MKSLSLGRICKILLSTAVDNLWEVDVLECDRCGGRMRILAAINRPEAIKAILECLGLPSRAPPISPALRDKQDFLS